MATIRLNKSLREKMLFRIISHAFGERKKALKQIEYQLAQDVYNDVYPTKVRKAISELPKGFVQLSSDMKLQFDNHISWLNFGKCLPVGYNHMHAVAKQYPRDSELTARFLELEKQKADLKSEKDSVRHQARATINSCTTVNRLLTVWPEIAPLVGDLVADAMPSKQLAVPTPELNKALGLPVEETTS